MSKTYRHLRQDQASTYSKRQAARNGVWRRGKMEFNTRNRREDLPFTEGTHSAVPPPAVRRGMERARGGVMGATGFVG